MDIIITVTDEQLETINKANTTEKFLAELTAYANGLVTFYVGEGDKVTAAEEAALDAQRLEALKADETKLAEVDAVITAKEEV